MKLQSCWQRTIWLDSLFLTYNAFTQRLQITPLTALLNLLTNLSYTLPSFHAPLVSQRISEQDETPQLLWVLCKIIRDQLRKLDTAIEQEQPELCSLGKQTLSLLEVIVWKIPDDLEDV